MDKVNAYNLGELGVNVTKSPIHLTDGELVNAQNAEFYDEAGKGALRKRPGLQRFNGSALSGAINGVLGVPLPAPNQRLIIVAELEDTGAFVGSRFFYSTDFGADGFAGNFDTGADGVAAQFTKQDLGGNPSGGSYVQPTAVLENRMFFGQATGLLALFGAGFVSAIEPLTPTPTFIGYAATRINGVAASGFLAMAKYKGYLYLATLGTGGSFCAIYELNPRTAALQQIGTFTTFDPAVEAFFSIAGFLGRIYVGTSRTTTGRIYSARVGDNTWRLENTASAGLHSYTSLIVFQGNLYMATAADAGTAALIQKMAPDGTVSTSATGSHTTQKNYFDGLFVFRGELYAFYQTRGSTDICEVWKFDGSSWSVDEDLAAIGGSYILGVQSAGSYLFVSAVAEGGANGRVFRRDSAGTWTTVFTTTATIRGHLGVI